MKLALALSLSFASLASAVTVDFSDKPLADDAYVDTAPFTSNGVAFNNLNTAGFWRGWSYSAVSDATTPGFTNQYAAAPGAGVGGSGTYAIGYLSEFENYRPIIDLPGGLVPQSVRVTNTTYAALSMRDGDPFAKKFGGAAGTDPDTFTVTFTGYAAANAGGATTGSTTFFLADFTAATSAGDYIVDDWTAVDLTALGAARSIALTFASTDSSFGFTNTPTYVAIDDLVLVPEPAALAAIALPLLAMRRRRSR